jgi:hypothetical protein
MDLNLLDTLKEKLVHARDFSEVWAYFFDHFGEDPEFIACGERARHSFLEAVLTQVGSELFGRKVPVSHLLLTRLPERQFLHGGFSLNGRLANVIYFEDIQVGLIAVVLSMSSGETRLARFSGRPRPVSREPSVN